MKTQAFRALGVSLGGLFVSATLVSAFTPTIPPQITSPANDSTASTATPLLIEVDTGDVPDVQSIEILANGSPIGWAYHSDFFGEWSFPGGAHLSVMKSDPQWSPDSPPVIVDYHPDDVSPMLFFEGDFTSPAQFSGTFETNTWPTPDTGNLTIDFTRVNGKVNIVITGDAPVETREHTGGVLQYHDGVYSCEWASPNPGTQSLTAKVSFINPTTMEEDVITTSAVMVTVSAPAAPEIDVRVSGRRLKDNKSSTGFGKVRVKSKSDAVTYTIRNVGTAPLKNLKVVTKGAHAKDFQISKLRKSSLAPKKEMKFTVRFAPRKTGTRKAQLRILSNDADENPFRVSLQGRGIIGAIRN